MNTSAYVSDPNAWVDPMGLVEWTGSAYNVSIINGVGVNYDLKSQCVNGKKGIASVYVAGYTLLGAGLPLSSYGTSVTFIDPYNDINLEAIQGPWGDISANISFIKGVSLSKTVLGEAMSSGVLGTIDRGHVASVGTSLGVTLPQSTYRTESCSVADPIKCNGYLGKCINVPHKKKQKNVVNYSETAAPYTSPQTIQPPLNIPSADQLLNQMSNIRW